MQQSNHVETKVFKNGKALLKTDGIVVKAGEQKVGYGIGNGYSPEIHLWDKHNRYSVIVFRGVELGYNPSDEVKIQVLQSVLQEYLSYRGTRTSWTINDAWMKRWKEGRNDS